jgi:hypothetical protein
MKEKVLVSFPFRNEDIGEILVYHYNNSSSRPRDLYYYAIIISKYDVVWIRSNDRSLAVPRKEPIRDHQYSGPLPLEYRFLCK